jgi:predicted nucleotidyltransferase component of viral defense system
MQLEPKTDILPEAQKKIWPYFRRLPNDFVLYGGTAVALRYGHRQSVDFDFFTSRQGIDLRKVGESISIICKLPHEITLVSKNHVDFLLLMEGEGIKVTFLNDRDIVAGSVMAPDISKDNNLKVASSLDLMACKILALHNRNEAKDFCDVAEMIKNDVPLQSGFEAAYAISKISRLGSKQLMLDRLKEDFKAKSTEKILAEYPDKNISSKAHEYATILKTAANQLDIDKIPRTRIRATAKIECGPEQDRGR